MTSNTKNVTVLTSVLLLCGMPVAWYLNQHAWHEDSLNETLRLTARSALLIYLLIFIARPLRQLTANSLSRWLVANRRYLGISFAAVMIAHLYLLVTLNGVQLLNSGVLVYLLILLMLLTSFDRPTAALGPKRWKILHKTGLYVIGIALAQAQFTRIAQGVGEPVHYLLAALILIAIGIRMAAWRKQRIAAGPAGELASR
ncbi:MAG: hypothetical protein OEM63_05090 [Gammaproteobacteria bacterium]|nr:hypothetical protein [Gammaproteobacteria bacterium]